MNPLFDTDNQAMLISFAFFLALFLFNLGVTQVLSAAFRPPGADRKNSRRRGCHRTRRRRRTRKKRFLSIDRHFREDRPARLGPEGGGLFRLQAEVSPGRNPSGERLIRALGIKIFLTVLFPAVFLLVRTLVLTAMSYQITLAVTVVCALMGFYLPDIYLNRRAEGRREKILQSLPDALDLMVICVEAGMGLDSAINKVAQELKMGSRS